MFGEFVLVGLVVSALTVAMIVEINRKTVARARVFRVFVTSLLVVLNHLKALVHCFTEQSRYNWAQQYDENAAV